MKSRCRRWLKPAVGTDVSLDGFLSTGRVTRPDVRFTKQGKIYASYPNSATPNIACALEIFCANPVEFQMGLSR